MAIVDVSIEGANVLVRPQGIYKLWGLHGDFRIPLGDVVGVQLGHADFARPKGLRSPGLGWFNRWAGTFRKSGERTYWCAATGPTLELELRNQYFNRMVLSPENPESRLAEIEAAIS